jgi:stage II sporulation protein D
VKRRCHWALGLVMLIASAIANAQSAHDAGGRDVSVALFSTRSLHVATVTPLGDHSWIAPCARCAHQPLTSPLHVAAPMEVFAGGTLRISGDVSEEGRTATGLWHLRASGHGDKMEIDVVLTLPSERYVAAVLNAEAAASEPAQSLRAMAILARTYALNGSHYAAQSHRLPAELCDSTQCQAILLGRVSQSIEDATRATAGETLWFSSHRAEVFFSQNCGGLTEDAGAVWPGLRGVPYLHSHADPYCMKRNTAAWHAEVPLAKFVETARVEGWHVPANIVAAGVKDRSASHRALRVVFTGGNGATTILSASALRFGIGRVLGWNLVRSDAFELGVRNGALIFDGRGRGHGVGFCQEGAAEMAIEGRTAREILAFYFSGTAVRILPSDQGWQETRVGALAVRATEPLTVERRAVLEQAWSEARRRFPPRHAITPEVVFAPTTEVFRQLTRQPGWALASTGGGTIVLQPEGVLQAHGRNGSATLLHEMLHVLVEAEASERTPLWLREGLVGVLAGDPTKTADAMTANVIESTLQHADSLQASQRAHTDAAVRVHGLIDRYGLSTVRGWLSSGVPVGVE